MAVQWDSEKGFNGVAVDVFDAVKNKILGIKKEIPELGEMTKDALGWLQEGLSKNELKEIFNDETILKNIGQTKEEFMSFIDDVDLSGDVFAQYQERLQANTKDLTLFQRAGKAAGNAIKSIGAALGSMAATWAIREVISLVATGISNYINEFDNLKEKSESFFSSVSEFNSKIATGTFQIEELSEKYYKLSEGVSNSIFLP